MHEALNVDEKKLPGLAARPCTAVSVLVRIPRCGGEQLKQLRRVPSIDLCIGPTIVLLLPEAARVCLQWNWKQQGDDWRPCIQKKPRKWRRRGSNSLCFDPFRHEIDSVGTAIVIEIDRRPGPYIPSHSVWDVAAKHMRAMLVPPSPFSFYADVCVPNSAALTVRDSFATFIS